MNRRQLAAAAAALALGSRITSAQAQDSKWPNRPIRMVVPYPPGGATDAIARVTATALQEKLGVSVIVENRAGANGTIGAEFVRQSPADGYTLLGSDATHPTSRLVMRNVPYDPIADFTLLGRTAQAPVMLSINPALPVRSIQDMVAAAKQSPEKWSFAITSMGAPATLASIEFNRRFGTSVELVPYRGAAPAVTDVAAGNVPAAFAVIPSVLALVQSGQLRALATTSPRRSTLAPEVPSTSELGIEDFSFSSWYGVWAPKGLPSAIAERLNAVLTEVMGTPATAQRLAGMGFEPVAQSLAEAQAFIEAETKRNAALLASAKFEPE